MALSAGIRLGHSSTTVTADTYARHLPTGDKALVDLLDGEDEARPGVDGGKT